MVDVGSIPKESLGGNKFSKSSEKKQPARERSVARPAKQPKPLDNQPDAAVKSKPIE